MLITALSRAAQQAGPFMPLCSSQPLAVGYGRTGGTAGMMNYIAITDVDNWPDGWTDAQKIAAVEAAEEEIEFHTQKHFYQFSFVQDIWGNGHTRLELGHQDALISIASVERVTITGQAEEITTTILAISYGFDAHCLFGRTWKSGTRYRVTGVRGLTVAPQAIKDATAHLTQARIDETRYTTYRQGTKSEGSLSGNDPRRPLTGIEEVDNRIRRWTRRLASPRAV